MFSIFITPWFDGLKAFLFVELYGLHLLELNMQAIDANPKDIARREALQQIFLARNSCEVLGLLVPARGSPAPDAVKAAFKALALLVHRYYRMCHSRRMSTHAYSAAAYRRPLSCDCADRWRFDAAIGPETPMQQKRCRS